MIETPPLVLIAAVYTRINGISRIRTIETIKEPKE